MCFPSENLQISCKSLYFTVEELGISLRVQEPSCHPSSIASWCRKLMQTLNSCWQHIALVYNSNNNNNNNGISFFPNDVPNIRKLPVFLLLILLCASCVDAHYQSPQNVAKNIEERVFINCSLTDTVHPCKNMVWTHYSAHNLAPTVIFMGGNLSSLVSDYISIPASNDGHCNLEVKTQKSAEGKYECSSSSTDKKESASLIILAAGYPECTIKTVGQYSNITCSVEYFGDWAPTMEWIQMTGQNNNSISSYDSYTSKQIVSAHLLVHRNVPSSYKFIMKFNETGRNTETTTTATNVPDYQWISPIFVLGEEGGGKGEKETAYPLQMSRGNSFGFNGRVVILSLFLWLL